MWKPGNPDVWKGEPEYPSLSTEEFAARLRLLAKAGTTAAEVMKAFSAASRVLTKALEDLVGLVDDEDDEEWQVH